LSAVHIIYAIVQASEMSCREIAPGKILAESCQDFVIFIKSGSFLTQ
jgi:hypothetical protein